MRQLKRILSTILASRKKSRQQREWKELERRADAALAKAAAFILARKVYYAALIFTLIGIGFANATPQPRIRTDTYLIFYAAPNGNDLNNNCLNQATPCTPYGAHLQAQFGYDYAPGGGCLVQFANGTYTDPDKFLYAAGQFVGAHLCQTNGNVDPSTGACRNADDVTFDVPAGRAAFNIQDGMTVSINCVRCVGAGTCIYGRQVVIIDLANINCGNTGQCITAEQEARVKTVGFFVISSDMNCFVCISDKGLISFSFASIIVTKPVTVPYFAIARRWGNVEFFNASIYNPELIKGSGGQPSQCMTSRFGAIEKNGTPLPCAESTFEDGKIFP